MMLVNFFTVTLFTLIIKILCLLVTIAYYTLAERKIMASVQRRLGPNVVGFWGLLQPLADGLKLFGKELVIPSHANSRIFIFAPMGVLGCAFLAWGVIPFHLFDHSAQMSVSEVSRILLRTSRSHSYEEYLEDWFMCAVMSNDISALSATSTAPKALFDIKAALKVRIYSSAVVMEK